MVSDAISRPQTEICIVGAGPVGLTLALALADADISVTLVSRDPPWSGRAMPFDGRAYSIAAGCWNIWHALDITSELEEHALPVTTISAETRGGRPIIFTDADLESDDGPLGYMVEAARLQKVLQDRVDASALISCRFGATIDSIKPDAGGVTVGFAGSEDTLTCRLIVGCDGRGSSVRRLSEIRWLGHDYNASGLVATARLDRPHKSAARQMFLPSGPFAVLPLPKNRANFVWSEPREVADTLCALSDEDFTAELEARLGDFVGGFKLEGPRYAYPLAMRIADRFYSERVALAGDAAHAIHPLAGQGLNLGLKDVAALAEAIVEHDRLGLDLGAMQVLERYDAERRGDVVSTALAMDGFDKLFTAAPSALRLAAGAGMGWVGELEKMRSLFVRQASALDPLRPRLMRGESFKSD